MKVSCIDEVLQRVEATQSTAAEIVLNPQVQVVAPAMYQAFRRADMLNNIIAKSLRSNRYRLKNFFQLACTPGDY